MGCDIHMVLEVKNDADEWVGLHAFPYFTSRDSKGQKWPATSRNYALFSDLADVRTDDNEGPKPDPKGCPDDMSQLAQMEVNQFGCDGHSHTWYMLDEAWPIFAAHMLGAEILSSDREGLCDRLFGVDAEEAGNHRLIIWFDN